MNNKQENREREETFKLVLYARLPHRELMLTPSCSGRRGLIRFCDFVSASPFHRGSLLTAGRGITTSVSVTAISLVQPMLDPGKRHASTWHLLARKVVLDDTRHLRCPGCPGSPGARPWKPGYSLSCQFICGQWLLSWLIKSYCV